MPDKKPKLVSENRPGSIIGIGNINSRNRTTVRSRIRRGPDEVQLPRRFCCNFFVAVTEVLVIPF